MWCSHREHRVHREKLKPCRSVRDTESSDFERFYKMNFRLRMNDTREDFSLWSLCSLWLKRGKT